MTTLPKHIRATRRGIGESEYDINGELAPLQWRCRCGSVVHLELMDWETEQYVRTPKELTDNFLEQHNECTVPVYCYSCKEVEVGEYGDWCANCSD